MAFMKLQANLSMKESGNNAIFHPMSSIGERIKWLRKRARLTQEQFANALSTADGKKISRGAVGNWELGTDRPSADNQTLIAEKFDITLDWLAKGEGPIPQNVKTPTESGLTASENNVHNQTARVQQNARIGEPLPSFARIPIRGIGMGGKEGYLILGDQYLGDTLAPPALVNVPDAYAVHVIGDSMLERYRNGEIVYVHPYAPVRKDDDCVIQIEIGDGVRRGYVKRFVSYDDRSLKVLQLHPRKFIIFPKHQVVAVHRIMMGGPS